MLHSDRIRSLSATIMDHYTANIPIISHDSIVMSIQDYERLLARLQAAENEVRTLRRTSTQSSTAETNDADRFQSCLQTRFEEIFTVDETTGIFTAPEFMEGVPRKPLNDQDGYWSPSWTTPQQIQSNYNGACRELPGLERELESLQGIDQMFDQ